MTDRLVPAAEQLLAQLDGRRYRVRRGEADGIGRIRTLTFDPHTSRWLSPVLDAIGDERIKSITPAAKGRGCVIEFVADSRADFRTPYPLDEVSSILND